MRAIESLTQLVARLEHLEANTISYFEGMKLVRKSYPEMHADVQRTQEKLRAWGVGAGTRVGIRGPNCYEWVVHELALLDLGCVTVTIPSIEFGREPVQALAERYGLELLLVAPFDFDEADQPAWLAPLSLEEANSEANSRSNSRSNEKRELRSAPAPLDPDVFTIVFSSGTTGALKAIQINRAATDEIMREFGNHHAFQPDDNILVALPLSTFQQRTMMYCAIWYGFDSIVVEPSPLMFIALKDGHPTIMGGPPAFYEILENRFRAQPKAKQMLVRALSGLIRPLPAGARLALQRKLFKQAHEAYGGRMRLMLSGSAPLRKPTSDVFAMMGLPLFQLYGLTESGFIAWNRPGRNRVGSVGKPVFPGSVEIADDGEIMVRWPLPQSPGYFDEPEEVERATYREGGWIATGDLGRFDDDGFLYIVGRKKDIILTRSGYKIAPSPIEQRIREHPDVAQAVLVGGGDLDYVGAVIGLRPNAGQDPAKVRQFVEDVNRELAAPSRVQRMVFTREQFTRENGLMTTTLKLNRIAVAERFGEALDRGETWS